MEVLLSAEDLARAGDKAQAALSRYAVTLVAGMGDPAFEEAYAALDAEFGEKGELESRDAVREYFARASESAGYRLVVARDERGALAGVRDCHVSVDPAARIVVVFLSHVLVLPEHRRSGLGALLRELPAVLGRRAARDLAPPVDVLLAGEMEPVTDDAATRLRLVVYGRAGFSIIDPTHLPYCQPDYRAHDVIDRDRARPLPLLAVVRWLDHERDTALPARLARAFVEHIYRAMSAHCREADLAAPRAHALAALARAPNAVARLLPPPRALDDDARLAPLSRDAVLAYHPDHERAAEDAVPADPR